MAGFRLSRQARDELGRVDAASAVDNEPWNRAKRENKRFGNKNEITILKRKSSFPVGRSLSEAVKKRFAAEDISIPSPQRDVHRYEHKAA